MFINLDKEVKIIQKKYAEIQDITQKYLVANSGERLMNDAYKSKQSKKKNFSCKKCYKQFLSFPALKEHSKKQHGFQPQTNGEVRKRGRPRRDVSKPSDQFHQWEQQIEQQPPKPKRPSSLITFYPDSPSMSQFKGKHIQAYRSELKGVLGDLITNHMIGEQQELEYLKRYFEEFNKSLEDQNTTQSDYYLDKNESVGYLFAAFIVNVAQFSTQELLKYLIVFVKFLFQYINSKGRDDLLQIVTFQDFGMIPDDNQLFHQIMPIEAFPLLLNSILEMLPRSLPNFPVCYASQLLKDICEWSYRECGGFRVYEDI